MKTNWLFLPLSLLVAISFGCDAKNADVEGGAETDDIDAVAAPADPGTDVTTPDTTPPGTTAPGATGPGVDADAATGDSTAPEPDETPAVEE